MSKAYVYLEDENNQIVFADSPGKAKSILRNFFCGDYHYTEISISRVPALDYLNKPSGYVMDWNDEEDRYAVVKNLDWHCCYDDMTPDECRHCKALELCEYGQDYLEEEE